MTFSTTKSLNYFKAAWICFNLSASYSANLLLSNLSTCNFQLVKLAFLANFDVSTPVAFVKWGFVVWLDKYN